MDVTAIIDSNLAREEGKGARGRLATMRKRRRGSRKNIFALLILMGGCLGAASGNPAAVSEESRTLLHCWGPGGVEACC